ncbi:alanine racemase [Sulfitobacter sp. JB4-11]|uniref:alanine racemase n=1 Tax=Sulfitobacter rhodophyticola TaxID=3238304 RepID=UPI003D819AFB
MSVAQLTIDLPAIVANWRALDAAGQAETGAVLKANAYGLGMDRVGPALATAGARHFFVAAAKEGRQLRRILGPGPVIYVFSGHVPGDADLIRAGALVPLINSVDQLLLHVESLPGHPFGIQLDSGMNRLGMEPAEWSALRDLALAQKPELIMSHLACADEPKHTMNMQQLKTFSEMTEGLDVPRSLAATGGILLGSAYHFELTRPGVGLYGGLPFVDAKPVVTLDIPVIQTREVQIGESVGYGNAFVANRLTRVATIAAGYADGLIRAMGPRAVVTADGVKAPVIGRVSMDMLTVDITDIDGDPQSLQMLGVHQSVDTVAEYAGTIGYEVLTSLGARYDRTYVT